MIMMPLRSLCGMRTVRQDRIRTPKVQLHWDASTTVRWTKQRDMDKWNGDNMHDGAQSEERYSGDFSTTRNL